MVLFERLGSEHILNGPLIRMAIVPIRLSAMDEVWYTCCNNTICCEFFQYEFYTIVVSFFICLFANFQYIARDIYSVMEAGWERVLVLGLGLIFRISSSLTLVISSFLMRKDARFDYRSPDCRPRCNSNASFCPTAQVNFRRREI